MGKSISQREHRKQVEASRLNSSPENVRMEKNERTKQRNAAKKAANVKKEEQRAEAQLPAHARLERLDKLHGKDKGAKKERAKLAKLLKK